jgi:hypothetical protein
MFDRGTTSDSGMKEERLYELRQLDTILKDSHKCTGDYVCEAAWNEDVHRPVLKLALKGCTGIESRNLYAR